MCQWPDLHLGQLRLYLLANSHEICPILGRSIGLFATSFLGFISKRGRPFLHLNAAKPNTRKKYLSYLIEVESKSLCLPIFQRLLVNNAENKHFKAIESVPSRN